MARTDSLTQRVVASVPQHRRGLQGVDAVLEGKREPVRDHYHVAPADVAEPEPSMASPR